MSTNRRWVPRLLVCGLALTALCVRSVVAEDPPAAVTPQMKELVGPVALYPDSVLTSVLPASAYPDDVVAAAAWVAGQPSGQALTAPADSPWDKSVQMLVQFP